MSIMQEMPPSHGIGLLDPQQRKATTMSNMQVDIFSQLSSQETGSFKSTKEDCNLDHSAETTVIADEICANASFHVKFEPGDKRDPANFSHKNKWVITVMACLFTLMASIAASAYNMGFPSMIRDLHCTEFQATVGLSVFPFGTGVVAMLTMAFSEEFGRQEIYLLSIFGFTMMYLMIALSKNIETVIVARFLQAAFGSTGATMVGGSIADLWHPDRRGLPMSLFSMGIFGGLGLGPTFGGWVEMNTRLGWRWIQWIQFIICGVYLLAFPFLMRETRSSIILIRLAKRKRQQTGEARYHAQIEDKRQSLKTLLYISCTRPIYLLFTEPIIASFSVWIGFAWGVTYGTIESVSGVFKTLHNFGSGEIGTVLSTMIIGGLLGFFANMYQDILYRRRVAKRGPEARLYSACFAAVLVPIGMYIYAWTSFARIHWVAPVIGLVLFMWGTFLIFLVVFNYLAECYGTYASSALAGQSLFRNTLGAAFPLFIPQMYERLTYKWASTVIASIALVLVPIPYILFFYGPALRRRSKVASSILSS